METTQFYQQLCDEETRLADLLSAVKKLKANYVPVGVGPAVIQESHPQLSTFVDMPSGTLPEDKPYFNYWNNTQSSYDKNSTQIQKVIFGLRKIKRGFRDDVAKAIHAEDTSVSLEEATKFSAYHLSKLYRLNLIGANKIGYRNQYRLK